MPYYRKRRKRIDKKTIALYSGIVAVCFLVGETVSFMSTRMSTYLQQHEKSSPTIDTVHILGKQVDPADLEEFEKTYSVKIDHASLQKTKGSSKAETITNAFEQAGYHYRGDKLDTASIEKFKEAYHEREMNAPNVQTRFSR